MAENSFSSFFRKNIAVLGFGGVITLGGVGAYFGINSSTGAALQRCTDTGCTIFNLNVVGTLTDDGVAVGGLSQTNADARYVNTSGDTMTGGLTVRATISGSTIQGYKRCPSTMVFSVASGSAIATGTATTFSAIAVPESMSGQILKRLFAEHLTLGVTNATKYKLFNKSKGNVHLNNIAVQVDSAEDDSSTAATAYTLNGTNNIVSGNDLLGIYVPTVSTTAPKGAVVKAEFDCQ